MRSQLVSGGTINKSLGGKRSCGDLTTNLTRHHVVSSEAEMSTSLPVKVDQLNVGRGVQGSP